MLSKHLFLANFYELKLRVFYILFTFLITFVTSYFYCDNILLLKNTGNKNNLKFETSLTPGYHNLKWEFNKNEFENFK